MKGDKVTTGASVLILLGATVLSFERLYASCLSPTRWSTWGGIQFQLATLGILIGAALLGHRLWAFKKKSGRPLFLMTENQGIRFLIVASALALTVLILRQCFVMNSTNAIYLTTGFVLLWYTVETSAMRWQMVVQNEIAVRTYVIALIEARRIEGESDPRKHLILRNIGKGPALFVQLSEIELAQDSDGRRVVVKFSPVDCIEAGKEAVVSTGDYLVTDTGETRTGDFLPSLDPRSAIRPFDVTICYENIKGQTYETHVRLGKGGIRILRPTKNK